MVQNTSNKRFGTRQVLALIIGICAIPAYAANSGALQQHAQRALDQGNIQGALQLVAQMGSNRRAQNDMYRRIAQAGTQLQQQINTYAQQLHTSQAAVRTAQQRQQQAEQQAIEAQETAQLLQQALEAQPQNNVVVNDDARVQELQTQLHIAEQQTIEAQETAQLLQQALEAQPHNIAAANDGARVQELQDQLQTAQGQIQELEEALGNVDQLIVQQEADARTIAELQQANENTQQQAERARAHMLQTHEEQVQALQMRAAVLEEQVNAQAAPQADERLEQELVRIRQQHADAQTQCEQYRGIATELRAENETLETRVAELQQERETAMEQRNQAQQAYARMEQQQRANAEAQSNTLNTRITELEQRNQELEVRIERAQQGHEVAAHVLHYQQQQQAHAENNSNTQDARITELEQRNQELTAHCECVQHERDQVQQQHAAVEADNTEQATRIAELEADLERAQQRLEVAALVLHSQQAEQNDSCFADVLDQKLADLPRLRALLQEQSQRDAIEQTVEGFAEGILYGELGTAVTEHLADTDLSRENAEALQTELEQIDTTNMPEATQERVQTALRTVAAHIAQLPIEDEPAAAAEQDDADQDSDNNANDQEHSNCLVM